MSERANRAAQADEQQQIAATRHMADAGTGVPLLEEEAKIYAKLEDARMPETKDGCFVAGTLVWTDKGQIPIEQIKVGDMVLSQPEAGGERAFKQVVDTFVYDDKEIWYVAYFDPRKEDLDYLYGTGNHPVWIKGVGWTAVESIKAGQLIELEDGTEGAVYECGWVYETPVKDVGFVASFHTDVHRGFRVHLDGKSNPILGGRFDHETLESAAEGYGALKVRVYNIEVEDFHTYYAGNFGLWVHNVDCAKQELVESAPQKNPAPPEHQQQKSR